MGPSTSLARADGYLVTFTAALMVLGLFMILSASSLEADAEYGDRWRFVTRQAAGIGIGGLLSLGLLFLPIPALRRLTWPSFVAGLLASLLVWSPLGHTANGATRWVRLGPVNLQPSEFVKVALVLALAHVLDNNRGRLRDEPVVLGVAVTLIAATALAILPQKDFGTTVLLFGLGGVLLFLAGLRWRWVFGLAGLGGAALAALIAIEPYRMVRLVSFVDPFADQSGAGYQVVQGWIALATGGVFGQGFSYGVAQRGFLPEPHTDFISAIVGEELGAVGWLAMVGLYIGIVWRAFVIASRSRDLYAVLTASGLGTLLGAQVIINLGVVGGLLPNKGLVLPFLSYGASAVLAHTLVVGLLVRLSIDAEPAPAPGATTGRMGATSPTA